MLSGRTFAGKRLPLTIAFTLLLLAAFGAGCKGFFVPPTLTSITINPTTPSVQLGSTTTVQAYGINSNNEGMYLTSGVSWSSSDNTIATVTGTGSATLNGVALGTVTLTAASESVTNTATATVYIAVSQITIMPTSQSIAAGGTTSQPYVVTATTSSGTMDISSSATLAVYTAYPGGTQITTVTCTYDASGSGGAGQYCTDNGGTTAGNYAIVASYTGTTEIGKATLNVQ
jgi:uncharacterized protein YjdB